MKRKLSFILVLIAIMVMLPSVVFADGADTVWTAEDFTYEDYDLPTASNQSGEAVYPGNKTGVRLSGTKRIVTGFSESGFEKLRAGNSDLVIPAYDTEGNLIQGIGKNAFSASVNSGMKEAGVKLTSLELPAGVFSTEHLAYVMENWTDCISNRNMTELGDFFIAYGAFGSNNISELTIPEGVLYIGDGAFANNKSLTRLTLPSSLAVLEARSFQQCALSEVTFPQATDIRLSIRTNTFAANKLSSVNVPKDTLQIARTTFFLNTGSGEPVTGGSAAENRGEVVTVYLPVTGSLGEYIDTESPVHRIVTEPVPDDPDDPDDPCDVYGHTLTEIEAIPATCEEDGSVGYWECSVCGKKFTDESAASVVTDTVIPALGHDWDEGIVITVPGEGTNGEILYTCRNDPSHTRTEYIYPEWEAGDFTYEGNAVTGLSESGKTKVAYKTDLVIPDAAPDGTPITEIGNRAFYETGITSVEYPAGLEKIGEMAFSHTMLAEAVIPDTVTEIGSGAFAMDWALSRIVIPDGITVIPDGAFNRQTIRGDKYDDYPSVGDIVIPDEVTYIGQSAFFGLSATSVTLPGSLLEMGQSAFSNNCISEVDIPGTLKAVPRQAFARGMAMFNDPVPLTSLTLHEGTETIGRNAFENSGLTMVVLPSTITSIDDTAFRVGMGTTPFEDKILLRGTTQQHLDSSINTGTGYGHRFIPLVTFDPNGVGTDLRYAEVNDDFTLSGMPSPEGGQCYIFSGWARDSEGTDPAAASDTFTTDTTLYAVWTEDHDYIKEVIRKPTATEEGLAVYTCTKDASHTYTEEIPKFTEEEISEIEAAKDELTEQIVAVNEKLSNGRYTSASFKAAREAIAKANEIFDDPTATAADIKAARVELMRSLRTLEPADIAAEDEARDRNEAANELARTLIDIYAGVSKSAYTSSSYSKLSKAVKAAEKVLSDESSDAEALRKANSSLLTAWKDLKKKAAQPMKVKARALTVRAKKLKKKATAFSAGRILKVSKVKGRKSYSIVKASKARKYFSINSKTGKLKIRKGLKKGTYRLTVKVKAAGNGNYRAGSKTAVVKVRVK